MPKDVRSILRIARNVVIGAFAVAGILWWVCKPRMEGGRVRGVDASLRAGQGALYAYRAVHGAYPPTQQGLRALIEKPTADPTPAVWRKVCDGNELPSDPWGNAFAYQASGWYDSQAFEIHSLGPDGV